jgi:hypothetical protein
MRASPIAASRSAVSFSVAYRGSFVILSCCSVHAAFCTALSHVRTSTATSSVSFNRRSNSSWAEQCLDRGVWPPFPQPPAPDGFDCRACGNRTSSARFSYLCERLLCDHCGAENPQTDVRSVETRDIFVRFITSDGCSVQAVDLNLDRTFAHACPSPAQRHCAGSWLRRRSQGAARIRSLRHQSHGKGNVRITLEPGRKNLLRLHRQSD